MDGLLTNAAALRCREIELQMFMKSWKKVEKKRNLLNIDEVTGLMKR